MIYHWKEPYAKGGFKNKPLKGVILKDRIRQPEQLVGKMTLENEFLKSRLYENFNTSEEKRQFIIEHRHLIESTERECKLMKLPRITYINRYN